MVPRPLAFGGGGGLGAAILAAVAHWLSEEPSLAPVCARPCLAGDFTAVELTASLFDRPAVPGLLGVVLGAIFLAGCCCGGAFGLGVGFWLGRPAAISPELRGPPTRGCRCPG